MKGNEFNVYMSIFQNAMRDIEALKEFYARTRESLLSYRMGIEKKYQYGKRIGELLDSIYNEKSIEQKNDKINEIMEIIIFDNIPLKNICKIIKFDSDTKTVLFSMFAKYKGDEFFPPVAIQKYDSIKKNEYILMSSILSNIITIFESALSRFYRQLILQNPRKYLENQTISLSAVFEDLAKAMNDKIDAEVEAKLYNSLELIDKLEKSENININRYGDIKSSFAEIYYRRNSYIHTNGCANRKYLTSVSAQYVKNVKENQQLVCDDIYLENAILVLTKMIFLILFELLNVKDADTAMFDILGEYFFNRLKNEEYELASSGYYALNNCKKLDFKTRTMFRINYINAQKQLGNKQRVSEEISTLDVSIATDDYKIAKECLLNNHEKVYNLLIATYPQSFSAVQIKDWPIFVDFRKTDWFGRFVAAHKKDFDFEQIDTDDSTKISDSNNDE